MRRTHLDENERPHGTPCALSSITDDKKGFEYEED